MPYPHPEQPHYLVVEFVREKVLTQTSRISAVRQQAIRRKLREIFGL